MKIQLKKILIVIVILFGFVSTNFIIIPSNQGTASSNQTIQNIAVILDSPEFYDSYFINDVLNGFDLVNQTYNIDYEVFQLTNYSSPPTAEGSIINRYPYDATYYYDGRTTNNTQLADELANTGQYDLIILMGYELRRGKKDNFLPARHNETNFLYYDLSGELPPHIGASMGDNVAVVSFNESHAGFIAGTLTATTISPLPQKIALIGTFRRENQIYEPRSDSRSWQLIMGFQGGFLRKASGVELLITYVDYYQGSWTDSSAASELAEELNDREYELVFSALQNNNTLGVLDGFLNSVITVDSNRTLLNSPKLFGSVAKNNTKAILSIFETFNQSENGFLAGEFPTFGLEDNIFYPCGWDTELEIDNIMEEIYTEIVINKIKIPTDIKHAENTSGFEILSIFVFIICLSIFSRFNSNKKRR